MTAETDFYQVMCHSCSVDTAKIHSHHRLSQTSLYFNGRFWVLDSTACAQTVRQAHRPSIMLSKHVRILTQRC